MTDEKIREKRAVLNIVVSLCYQAVSIVCGVIIPQLMIRTYGSELYGATTSILNFLSYITLLEGGVCGVGRAALYKPLAENDTERISAILMELKKFFRIIGYIFVIYVIILAFSFSEISHIEVLNWKESFLLVIIISMTTCAEYFLGMTYSILIQANQKTYITDLTGILATALNTLFVILLIHLDASIFLVKLVGSFIFILRPTILAIYVRKTYKLKRTKAQDAQDALKNKWIGLGQHIAYFLYSNTDIVVLTIFLNLKAVAVYSVYSLVIKSVESITLSCGSGMEAVFGELIAEKKIKELNKAFTIYETLLSIVVIAAFAVTFVMILPFVSLYTAGITDVNYTQPLFALLLILVAVCDALRTPYHNVVIAAGAFKETQWASYGEAAINLILSIILVKGFGLVGVAIGTLAAVLFRGIYYIIFLQKNIIGRKISLFIKREAINAISFILIAFIGKRISSYFVFSSYLDWVICAVLVSLSALSVVTLLNYIFYREFFNNIGCKFR